MPTKAAEKASSDKNELYKELKINNYIFLPYAVETMGPWSTEAIDFINLVGTKLQEQSGDKRSKHFLLQKNINGHTAWKRSQYLGNDSTY